MLLQAGVVGLGLLAASWVCVAANVSPADAKEIVARLDTQFQAAVKVNDASVMERVLHEDMVLVHGNGSIDTRAQLLEEARNKVITYEQQDEDLGTQTVRVWGDTAVVTARLWVKGVRQNGTSFDRRVWFSDIYIRTPNGWRYVFGQVSLHLPDSSVAQ
jgi:ketosteroid isomerase-like protein